MKPGETMDHRPTAAREELAALRDADPFTADMVESLLSDLPVDSDPRLIESMRNKAMLPRSARRSITQRHRAPRDPAPQTTAPHPQSGL